MTSKLLRFVFRIIHNQKLFVLFHQMIGEQIPRFATGCNINMNENVYILQRSKTHIQEV